MVEFRRTHNCNTLTKVDIGKSVTLSGWVNRRRDHGGLIFIDLRDRWGVTQLVFDPEVSVEMHTEASKLRSEWVISVQGEVTHRGTGLENPKLHTGEIEIKVSRLTILSPAKTPPFSVCDESIDVHEELRLKYRYLDIRRGEILKKLRIRHKAMVAVRNFLDQQDFTEVTTPILAKSTPEGARDYLVPSRIYPGSFYALPQSPQIFKQLLMLSGLDRYFQIATCFRDEDLRADRQPEFSQIDIEMSFDVPDTLFRMTESMLQEVFQSTIGQTIPETFEQMSYKDAIEHYGTDKPDLRFGMPLVRLDIELKNCNFSIFQQQLAEGGCIKAINLKGGADMSRRAIEDLASFVKPFGLEGLGWMKFQEGKFSSSIVKFFSHEELLAIQEKLQVEENDVLLFAAEQEGRVNQALDHLRRHLAKKRNLIKPNTYKFLWIVDFPLFQKDPETGQIVTEHHPFTSPYFEDMHLLDENPLKTRSLSYDLVLNGYELASGSQRIHNPEIQQKIFQILGHSEEDLEEKFGFFVKALQYGTPPHLGIALGFDRLVMILTQTENIRDVIAFPKTQKASDLMMQAPSRVEEKHLSELKISAESSEIASL